MLLRAAPAVMASDPAMLARENSPCLRLAACHVFSMRDQMPRILDMTPQGEFVRQPVRMDRTANWPLRLGLGAAVVAIVTGGLAVAALFLWVASVLLPVALVAGGVAYVAFRYQRWRARRL